MDKKAYAIVGEDNLQSTERAFYVVFSEIPDHVRWGVLIGDRVHNLRTSLDHVAWQAAGSSDAPSGTEYPIFKDRDLYEAPISNRTGGQWKIRGIQEPVLR